MSKIEIVKEQYDANGNQTYREWSDGFWAKYEYDDRGNNTYIENSTGFWVKYEYDENDNIIFMKDSRDITYHENSTGYKEGTPRAELEQEPDIERE